MIMARTSHIHKVDDFYMNESGMILLDSVCMKLVAVGEAIKNLDKITNKELLLKYPAVNWKDIKKIALHDKEHTHVEEQRILSYPLIIL